MYQSKTNLESLWVADGVEKRTSKTCLNFVAGIDEGVDAFQVTAASEREGGRAGDALICRHEDFDVLSVDRRDMSPRLREPKYGQPNDQKAEGSGTGEGHEKEAERGKIRRERVRLETSAGAGPSIQANTRLTKYSPITEYLAAYTAVDTVINQLKVYCRPLCLGGGIQEHQCRKHLLVWQEGKLVSPNDAAATVGAWPTRLLGWIKCQLPSGGADGRRRQAKRPKRLILGAPDQLVSPIWSL